ncbi:MAG: hypothetical protein ACE14M_16230 [Terriglobales bacterium]
MRFFNHWRHGHVVGSVYLVHFARRHHGAQHYMGFSTNVSQRVKAHRAGRARLAAQGWLFRAAVKAQLYFA